MASTKFRLTKATGAPPPSPSAWVTTNEPWQLAGRRSARRDCGRAARSLPAASRFPTAAQDPYQHRRSANRQAPVRRGGTTNVRRKSEPFSSGALSKSSNDTAADSPRAVGRFHSIVQHGNRGGGTKHTLYAHPNTVTTLALTSPTPDSRIDVYTDLSTPVVSTQHYLVVYFSRFDDSTQFGACTSLPGTGGTGRKKHA